MGEKEFFLILGCQRSGTTLTRLILECHSEIECFDELTSYRILAQNGLFNLLGGAGKKIGFKIPRWTEQLDDPILFDEGEPFTARRFYSGQRIIFLLRDVRDTVASMLKLNSGGTSWIDVWPPAIISGKLKNQRGFAVKYRTELALIETSRHRRIALAALYWKYKTQAFFEYERRGYPVFGVRYARLVTDPRPVLNRVCEFLRIPFQETLLHHPAVAHTEVFENGLTIGNTNPILPIHSSSVGDWRQHLSVSETQSVLTIAGETQEALEHRWPVTTTQSRPTESRETSGSLY